MVSRELRNALAVCVETFTKYIQATFEGFEAPALRRGKELCMTKATFKIRRKIILAFLFCFLSVLMFAILSFQIQRDIGRRLRLVEVADDIMNNILEIRRFEKNFFLYKHPESLTEALAYVNRVAELYARNERAISRLTNEGKKEAFTKILERYKKTVSEIKKNLNQKSAEKAGGVASEESLRAVGQELLDRAGTWAKEERVRIDRLFRQTIYLFVISMVIFCVLGLLVALYISRLFTQPLIHMREAMEKIAEGDFTPIPEKEVVSEEFVPLFRAFNRMSHELEERQEQLVQARKISAIGTFTSGIAHELNNPVNNIVLSAEALKEGYDDLTREEALDMIRDVLVQSERASEIIKNLLDFSRSEQPEMLSVSIPSVIQNTLRLVRNQMLLSGVEAEVELSEDLPTVWGEYKSLQQVFLNLFLNAVQAMNDGGTLRIRARKSDDGDWARVEVTDTGQGIEPENLPHIFDPFFTTKEVGKGTGLGLSVTYGIVQKHGGAIDVKSDKGKQTTFTISLPSEKEA
jgi:two-component system, NtrC family, sensor kinase